MEKGGAQAAVSILTSVRSLVGYVCRDGCLSWWLVMLYNTFRLYIPARKILSRKEALYQQLFCVIFHIVCKIWVPSEHGPVRGCMSMLSSHEGTQFHDLPSNLPKLILIHRGVLMCVHMILE